MMYNSRSDKRLVCCYGFLMQAELWSGKLAEMNSESIRYTQA